MDSQRLILFFVFAFAVFMLLDRWQQDQQPAKPAAAVADKADKVGKTAPVAPSSPTPPRDRAGSIQAAAPKTPATRPQSKTIRLETDVVIAQVDTLGGSLQRLELKQHRDTLDKTKAFVLLDAAGEHAYGAQSGLFGNKLPNQETLFESDSDKLELAAGSDQLELRLRAPEAQGLQVTKIYRFHRGSYLIDVGFEIANKGIAPVEPWAYFELVRNAKPPAGDSAMLPTFTGVGIYTEKKKLQTFTFEKFAEVAKEFPDDEKTPYPEDGWIAVLQHYFFSAWLPRKETPRRFYMEPLNGEYRVGLKVPVGSIAPSGTGAVTVRLYAGPEEQKKLAVIAEEDAPGLNLTVDYGKLKIIAVPLFWALSWLHDWVRNWGVSIIILTVIIKALFYPLSAASYRSMAKMRVLAPKMQKLKDQYGDDRQRMQQAMMELYKTEKINPLGGCMPILVQIPVFIALYWVLLYSVELRHAPFYLWIDDLSRPDPWFILPILMAATMWVQTLLNPEPPDPVQAKVMKIMPIVFSVFFFFFPAGLVLYWLVNNILSIAQQWRITRVLEREGAAARKKR